MGNRTSRDHQRGPMPSQTQPSSSYGSALPPAYSAHDHQSQQYSQLDEKQQKKSQQQQEQQQEQQPQSQATSSSPSEELDLQNFVAEPKNPIDRPDKVGYTALDLACVYDNLDAARNLLEAGANVEGAYHLNNGPLTVAARKGYVDMCRLMLEHGADVHRRQKQGYTPLMLAACDGQVDAIKVLLEYGARKDDVNEVDGSTALH